MNKKEALIPLTFVALSLLFLVVCSMVFISKGRSKKWVARKMKIGGLLLSLTAFQNTGMAQEITCYEPVMANDMRIVAEYNNGYIINIKQGYTVKGNISARQSNYFSFSISDKSGTILQKGELMPVDGKFNDFNEEFQFNLDKKINEGKYVLMLFDCQVREQEPGMIANQFDLFVKNE